MVFLILGTRFRVLDRRCKHILNLLANHLPSAVLRNGVHNDDSAADPLVVGDATVDEVGQLVGSGLSQVEE